MTRSDAARAREEREWLGRQFGELTDTMTALSPSEWAESRRYLPASNTALPGQYSFKITPYLREIVDCLGVDSPIREVTLMKGVQIGATVGVLENCIGYCIDAVKTAPVMLVTADAELAKLRMDSYVTPMLISSGLEHLLKSADENNARKKGKTDAKLEWEGGGFLIPFGAQNANKLRSFSIQFLLRDEIDGWPLTVGRDGDPLKLSTDRTAAYESSRKIFDGSTPTIKGLSKIAARFALGDQRYYHVLCLKCGMPQILRWRREVDGVLSGIVWDYRADGSFDPGSVRYLCQNPDCQHPHTNDDKTKLLQPSNGAHWKPTTTPQTPHHRSYHLSALYSPVGMQTWSTCVEKWLDAWDVERNRAKDVGALQVFYNNVLGLPFESRGDKVPLEAASMHKRSDYHFGQVPNAFARRVSGGPVLLLTCTVDVQKDNLAVAIFGWCKDHRAILIDYKRLHGNTELLDDPGTWKKLDEIIPHTYTADDGLRYRPAVTFIDSGYLTDQVYSYCATWRGSIHPVKGRQIPAKGSAIREFSDFKTPNGLFGFLITVDMYKDRWSAALKREWDGQGLQPSRHFNAPVDVTPEQLKELTVESKHPRPPSSSGQEAGFEWRRTPGAPNELWDLLCYANAAHDVMAWNYCRNVGKMESVSLTLFWDHCLQRKLYFA